MKLWSQSRWLKKLAQLERDYLRPAGCPDTDIPTLRPRVVDPEPPAQAATMMMPELERVLYLFRIKALEEMVADKDRALCAMSDVSKAPMITQFTELDGEYNRLFERSAKTAQKLFETEAAVRVLADLNSRYLAENELYRAAGIQISAPWWRHQAACPLRDPSLANGVCSCRTP